MNSPQADISKKAPKGKDERVSPKSKTDPATSGVNFVGGFVLPGLPHILLAADQKPEWKKLRQAFDQVKTELNRLKPDLLIIYSTYWASILGHQIQAREDLEWIHVDEQFHDLGSIPYHFKMDKAFASTYQQEAQRRGLSVRLTDYHGFPVDTGSVVVQTLLNPNNEIPAVIVSSNIYSDRAETILLGKAAREAVISSGRRAVAITITSLSNRLDVNIPNGNGIKAGVAENSSDREKISSLKDEEWNHKMLEFFSEGRLEDVAQLSRQFHREARVKKVTTFKPFWWLSATMGASNNYTGKVYEYQPMLGTGAAVIGLFPTDPLATNLEYDEEHPEYYAGDRPVLGDSESEGSNAKAAEIDSNFEHPTASGMESPARGLS